MKLYTFLDNDGEIIVQVRAEDRSDALSKLSYSTNDKVMALEESEPFGCDFYSEDI